MLAQFRVCISIEIDYLKYEVDFFPLFFIDISLPTNNNFAKNKDQKVSEMQIIVNNK